MTSGGEEQNSSSLKPQAHPARTRGLCRDQPSAPGATKAFTTCSRNDTRSTPQKLSAKGSTQHRNPPSKENKLASAYGHTRIAWAQKFEISLPYPQGALLVTPTTPPKAHWADDPAYPRAPWATASASRCKAALNFGGSAANTYSASKAAGSRHTCTHAAGWDALQASTWASAATSVEPGIPDWCAAC